MAKFTTGSKALRGAAVLAAVLVLGGCGDDEGSIASPVPNDSPSDAAETSEPPAADTDADTNTDDAAAPAAGAGTGTITIGDTTWEIEGTCNIPTEGVVLLTGTAVDDPSVEIYVTATPGLPDTDSAFVTKEGEFDWTTGSFVTSNGLQEPETSYEAGVGRGSAGFIDQDKPPLDEVYADGTWEFNC